MRPTKLAAPIALVLALAACGSASERPVDLAIGPNPQLPAPKKTLFPTVNVAEASGWPDGHDADPGARADGQ